MIFVISIVFGIICLLSLFVFLIDVIIYTKEYIARYHMGMYTNIDVWEDAILSRLKIWSKRMPNASVSDNRRLVIVDIIKERSSKNIVQSWQYALVYAALFKHYRKEKMQDMIEKLVLKHIDIKGKWIQKPKSIDVALLAFFLLKYTEQSERIKPAMDEIYAIILQHLEDDQLLCYRKSANRVRFVDTLGLVCPFLCLYGTKYNNINAVNLAIQQISEYEKHGKHPYSKLPVHAYDAYTYMPLGLYGWGRGAVWYILSICESYMVLENSDEKNYLKQIILKSGFEFQGFQNDNGGVGWLIPNFKTYDSSATAGYGYFYAFLYQMTNKKEYYIISKKALSCLMLSTRRNGAIDYSQGDTKGIGIYSSLFSIMPFTQGLAYLAVTSLKGE